MFAPSCFKAMLLQIRIIVFFLDSMVAKRIA